jgi:hypothetical protein
MSPEELVKVTLRLDELGRQIIRAFIEWNPTELSEFLVEFAESKRAIHAHLIENPVAQLGGETHAAARKILTTIAAGAPLPAEAALIGKLVDCGLDHADLAEIGSQELYSWISHIEYAEGLYKAGSLIINSGALPGNLGAFLREARQCFALQQYNAVCALCRAMVDISVRDIVAGLRETPSPAGKVVPMRPRYENLMDLIKELTRAQDYNHLRGQLERIPKLTNPIVHGGRTSDENSALDVLRETLSAVHRLYEVNSHSSRP